MTQNAYGTAISGLFHQSSAQAQVVIDTAVTVWMQMGLSENQILYGIAMMNVESGYDPVVTNGVDTDSIRGLGQFSTGTWNATALSFDKQYGLQPAPPVPYIANSNFDPQQSQGTNAQVGESNDAAAGVYDPDGLVVQLEVVGKGIVQEWSAATSSRELAAAQQLAALGVQDASLFVPNSSANSQLLSTVALAYLNHHEGAGWWSQSLTKEGITYFQQTANKLTNPKKTTGLASAVQRVVQGVQEELSYLNTHVANPTGTASDLLIGDPWALAGAVPTLSDPGAPIVISHDIPSIFPTIDNFYSQTSGGLTSYSVTIGSAGSQTYQVSYDYTTAGSAPLDVAAGSTSFNFNSQTGSGSERFEDGDTLTYTFSSSASSYQLQSTQESFLGAVTATESESGVLLAGREDLSQVFGDGSGITKGQLAYITDATQTEYEGVYDNQGRLITGIYSTSTQPAISRTISTSDLNYAAEAAELAQEFNVPVTDTFVVNASNPSTPVPDSTTSVDDQGDATIDWLNGGTGGTASDDPGFQAHASSFGLDSQLSDTLSGILQAYADLYEAEIDAENEASATVLLREIHARSEERFRNGNGTTVAIGQARTAALDAEESLNKACRSVTEKSAALAEAIGVRIPARQRLAPAQPLPMPFAQLHLQVEARQWRYGDENEQPPAHVGD